MFFLDKIMKYGVLIFVFLIPWQARIILSEGSINGGYWEYGTTSLYATEIILLFLMLCVVFLSVVRVKKAKFCFSDIHFFSPKFLFLVLIAWAGASVFWSYDKIVALKKLIVLIEAVFVFVVASSGLISKKSLAAAFLLSSTAQAILAMVQFFSQEIYSSTLLGISSQDPADLGVSVVETALRRWLRAYGSFPHPNILAGWIVMGLAFLVNDLRRKSKTLADIARYPILVILVSGLILTFSRSAWFGFLLFLIVCFFLMAKNGSFFQMAKTAFVVLITFFVFFTIFKEPIDARLLSEGRLESKSNFDRILSVSEACEIFKLNPFLGVGIGNYGLAVHNYIDNSREAWSYQPVHNTFLLFLAELGSIGTVIFAFLVLVLAKKSDWRFFIFMIIPVIVISFFDHYFWSLYPGTMMLCAYSGILLRPSEG